jgi:hypothetical protein
VRFAVVFFWICTAFASLFWKADFDFILFLLFYPLPLLIVKMYRHFSFDPSNRRDILAASGFDASSALRFGTSSRRARRDGDGGFASGFDASFAPRFRDDDAAGGSLARSWLRRLVS